MREKERKKEIEKMHARQTKQLIKMKTEKKTNNNNIKIVALGKKIELNEKNDIIAKSDYSNSARIG